MNVASALADLAIKLASASQPDQAQVILAQALELCDIRDIQLITPGHPLYEATRQVFRPHEVIHEKLEDFSSRLKV